MNCPRCGNATLDASYVCSTCGGRSALAQPEWPARPRPPLPWEDEAPPPPEDPWVRVRRARNVRDLVASSILVALFVSAAAGLVLVRRAPSGGDAVAVPEPGPMAGMPATCLDAETFNALAGRYRLAAAIELEARGTGDLVRWSSAIGDVAAALDDLAAYARPIDLLAAEAFAATAEVAARAAEDVGRGREYPRREIGFRYEEARDLLADATPC